MQKINNNSVINFGQFVIKFSIVDKNIYQKISDMSQYELIEYLYSYGAFNNWENLAYTIKNLHLDPNHEDFAETLAEICFALHATEAVTSDFFYNYDSFSNFCDILNIKGNEAIIRDILYALDEEDFIDIITDTSDAKASNLEPEPGEWLANICFISGITSIKYLAQIIANSCDSRVNHPDTCLHNLHEYLLTLQKLNPNLQIVAPKILGIFFAELTINQEVMAHKKQTKSSHLFWRILDKIELTYDAELIENTFTSYLNFLLKNSTKPHTKFLRNQNKLPKIYLHHMTQLLQYGLIHKIINTNDAIDIIENMSLTNIVIKNQEIWQDQLKEKIGISD